MVAIFFESSVIAKILLVLRRKLNSDIMLCVYWHVPQTQLTNHRVLHAGKNVNTLISGLFPKLTLSRWSGNYCHNFFNLIQGGRAWE